MEEGQPSLPFGLTSCARQRKGRRTQWQGQGKAGQEQRQEASCTAADAWPDLEAKVDGLKRCPPTEVLEFGIRQSIEEEMHKTPKKSASAFLACLKYL
ncbi:hypothetical protein AK812_SmicGene23190 [Symbiodinium microadriaticum]|uniref:Uncharacterized protein n=1 Tax=Symbiodinium microadriaticum TaxID=2951 RepID=A0A1Q9DHW7_SYMMI|nr:hypothetical protein AK812_SmicGene23190 [Symbiodinium microadriaticum]